MIATDGQQQSGGLVAVLAVGRRAYLRTHFISTALVAVWLKPRLPKARLAKDVCLHLAEQGAGFLSSEGGNVPEEAVPGPDRCFVTDHACFEELTEPRSGVIGRRHA